MITAADPEGTDTEVNLRKSCLMKQLFENTFCFIYILIAFVPAKAFSADGKFYSDDRIYARAEIIKIDKTELAETVVETKIHLKILDGVFKDKIKTAIFKGEDDMPKSMQYNKGDVLFVGISKTGYGENVEQISLYDRDNTAGIIFIFILLILIILAVGRLKGFLSIAALTVSVLLMFFIFIPFTLKGYPPLPVAVVIAVITIIITMPVIMGFRLKTITAALGASAGVVASVILAQFFGYIMHLSGVVTNEMLTVFYAASVEIDLRSIALSGMIIAALGAVIDVCISISSATYEIYNVSPDISEREAFKSVITIGRDMLGATVNTLILAYVGSSLPLMLIIAMRLEPGMPIRMLLNYNLVLSELVKSAVGCMGMFLCVPITAYFSVKLHGIKKQF
ncbi:MAG: YibE/F family protein [Spirochaetes bacterium]|nr:YibE/F family protein [Spirochaetota bacterium]